MVKPRVGERSVGANLSQPLLVAIARFGTNATACGYGYLISIRIPGGAREHEVLESGRGSQHQFAGAVRRVGVQ